MRAPRSIATSIVSYCARCCPANRCRPTTLAPLRTPPARQCARILVYHRRHVATEQQHDERSRHRAAPTAFYAVIPAIALGAFLVRGVLHEFRGNASALFYFGDAWLDGGALPRDPLVRKGP